MKKNKEKTASKITDFFEFSNIQKKEKENSEEYININLFEEKDSNSSLNNHGKNQNINNINNNAFKKKKIEENNINIKPSFFINLSSDSNRNLILLDLSYPKKLQLKKIEITANNFLNPKEYHQSFPFQNCRLINHNNIAFLIGGKKNDEDSKLKYFNNIGEDCFYKIVYNKEKEEIKINKITSCIFQHQSHSVLLCQKYNSILVLSGYEQKNCEYFDLKENKWETIYPLRKPRENAISLLYNEKYIFLIGGKHQEKINEDYDVIDFEMFLSKKIQNYWKTYEIKSNKNFLEYIGCGIISKNDNVYIFGGLNNKNRNKNEFFSWKINFERDENDKRMIIGNENMDKIYKINSIESCDEINNNIKKYNKKNNFGFFGQHNFFNFNGFFFNISCGGQLVKIPENIF